MTPSLSGRRRPRNNKDVASAATEQQQQHGRAVQLLLVSVVLWLVAVCAWMNHAVGMQQPHANASFDEPGLSTTVTSRDLIDVQPEKGSSSHFAKETYHETIQEFLDEMKTRNTRIKNICKNIKIFENESASPTAYKKLKNKLFVDMNHNMTWCAVYKAASTTMMQVFAKFKGLLKKNDTIYSIQNGTQLNKIIRAVYTLEPKGYHQILASTNKILVVRHPFARLLSAYRDKLERRENRKYYYEKYGRRIIKKYGNPKEQKVPTFTQFLQYISEDNYSQDEHWRPISTQCLPCLFPYDYVLKTESFDHEIKMVFTFLGIKEYLPATKLHVNQNGATTSQLANSYISVVPTLLLKKIYNIYEKDFNLFNYSPNLYFNMTKLNS